MDDLSSALGHGPLDSVGSEMGAVKQGRFYSLGGIFGVDLFVKSELQADALEEKLVRSRKVRGGSKCD